MMIDEDGAVIILMMVIDDWSGCYCRTGQLDDLMEQFEVHSLQSLMTWSCQ